MANLLTHSFEFDTLGSAPPTTGSPTGNDTPFDSVTTGSGATNVVDNTQAAHGTLSGEFATVTGAQSFVAWTTSMGTQTTIWFRFYIYLTANPSVSHVVFWVGQGTTMAASMQLTAAGKLRFQDTNGTTITGTTTSNSLNLNGWTRVEGFVKGSAAAGKASISLYLTPDSSTADETDTSTATQLTLGSLDHYRFGIPVTASNFGPFWMDDLGLSNTGLIGPAGTFITLADVAGGTETESSLITVPVALADVGAGVDAEPIPAIGTMPADVAGAIDAPVIAAAVPLPGLAPAGLVLDESSQDILDEAGGVINDEGPLPAVEPGAAADTLVVINLGTPVTLADVGAAVDVNNVLQTFLAMLSDTAAAHDVQRSTTYVVPGPAPQWQPPPPQPGNVLWGTGILLTAPAGTPLPADQQLGLASAWQALGWAYVGATLNGVQLSWAPGSTLVVQAEEHQIPVALAVQTGNVSIITAMAEETVTNMNLAFGDGSKVTVTQAGPGQPGKTVMSLSGTRPVMAAALIAMNPYGYPRVLSVPKVQSTGSLQVAWRRAQGPRAWQLTLEAVCPLSAITWNDITAQATS